MAIASTEPENPASTVILAVIRVPLDEVTDMERRMRQRDLVVLQKKKLELGQEEMASWFTSLPTSEAEVTYFGYVLQSCDAPAAWEQFTTEVGSQVCGSASEQDLRRLFPSVVVDRYLLQPAWCTQYLNQLKPEIIAGLEQVSKDKPTHPIQQLAYYLEKSSKK